MADMVLWGPIRLWPSPRGSLPDFGRPEHDEREPVPDPAVALHRNSPSSSGGDDPRGYVRGRLRLLTVAFVQCFDKRAHADGDHVPGGRRIVPRTHPAVGVALGSATCSPALAGRPDHGGWAPDASARAGPSDLPIPRAGGPHPPHPGGGDRRGGRPRRP